MEHRFHGMQRPLRTAWVLQISGHATQSHVVQFVVELTADSALPTFLVLTLVPDAAQRCGQPGMKILVLGSSAGGGFPQWNCRCRMCAAFRRGEPGVAARTQNSVAVSPDGRNWALLNASPDINQQLRANPQLHPRAEPRGTPIKAVVLTDSQLHNVAGLLSLRETAELDVYATPRVFEDLTAELPLLNVLENYCEVHWHMLPVAGATPLAPFVIPGLEGLAFCALAVPGAPPRHARLYGDAVGSQIAVQVQDLRSGQRFVYSPALAAVGETELDWMRRADCLMVDGTFWAEDELRAAGLSTLSASDLGHLPQRSEVGRAGMMDVLADVAAPRKILVHVNNSNPILDAGGGERRELDERGIEVAHDGMVIEL